jgi:hypothetical protein
MLAHVPGWSLCPSQSRHRQRARAARVAPRRLRASPRPAQGCLSRAQKLRFLAALGIGDRVQAAAFAAGVSLEAVTAERTRDPLFAAAWDRTLESRLPLLEAALIERAIGGVAEPVFFQGEQCGVRIRYNDTLGMQILRAHMPETYGRPARAHAPGAARSPRDPDGGAAAAAADPLAEEQEFQALLDTIRQRLTDDGAHGG